MFRRILVAMDGSESARAAYLFVSDWAREFDAAVWFVQLTDESATRRGDIATDVSRRGRQLSNTFTVSGATRSARNQQLVTCIVEAAEIFKADLIVFGFDRSRLAGNRFSRSVREQLSGATDIPVLVAPKEIRVPAKAQVPASRPMGAIALGPAPRLASV